jgi:Outer membrane protein beta-barrel domain
MRKQLMVGSILIAVLTCSTVAWAQVGGGIKVGVNLATLSGFNDASTSQRVGIVAGGFLTFGLAPMLKFQPEVLFSMQGSKLHFGTSAVSSDVTAKIDYVQVPLLLRIGNSGKSAASAYAIVGPTFGVLARHQGVTDELKTTDVGVVGGAGVTVSRLLLEGRYTYGLTDLNKGGTGYKNRVLSVLVGLVF